MSPMHNPGQGGEEFIVKLHSYIYKVFHVQEYIFSHLVKKSRYQELVKITSHVSGAQVVHAGALTNIFARSL